MTRPKLDSPATIPLCVAMLLLLVFVLPLSQVRSQNKQRQSAALASSTSSAASPSLSPLENEILQEINLARTRPADYAAYLEQWRPFFKGKTFQPPGKPAITTEEGVGALDEAIRVLRATRPLAPLKVAKGMCLGANLLVKDHGATGNSGHRGSDASLCEDRVSRFGSWSDGIGENLSYGTDSARERVIILLIDDGVANRGHRTRILGAQFSVAGVSCGDHSKLGTMCVVTFAGKYTEKANGSPAGAGDIKGVKSLRQY